MCKYSESARLRKSVSFNTESVSLTQATTSPVVIGHGIVGRDIPIMARLAKVRRWSKR
jgi:hypothetical protein